MNDKKVKMHNHKLVLLDKKIIKNHKISKILMKKAIISYKSENNNIFEII